MAGGAAAASRCPCARPRSRTSASFTRSGPTGCPRRASRAATRRHVMTGAPARGNSFISRLRKDNAEVGSSRWYVEERVLAWSFPGLTEGYLDDETAEDDRRVAVHARPGVGQRSELRVPLLPYARRHAGFRGTAAARLERKSPRAGDAHGRWRTNRAVTAFTGWTARYSGRAAMSTIAATEGTAAVPARGGSGGARGSATPVTPTPSSVS